MPDTQHETLGEASNVLTMLDSMATGAIAHLEAILANDDLVVRIGRHHGWQRNSLTNRIDRASRWDVSITDRTEDYQSIGYAEHADLAEAVALCTQDYFRRAAARIQASELAVA